jgi:hypothetical protein
MLQTYQGYIQEDGRLFSPELLDIPKNKRVLFTLVGDELPPVKTRSQMQCEALKDFFADNSGDDELNAEDYAELESGKYKLNFSARELAL